MDSRIASISTWEIFKIYSLSFLCGIWVYFKKIIAGLIKTESSSKNFRDKPPSCLVESSFGIHNYVKVRGTKFHYVESGSSQSPFLLLLHGFPDCWLSWRYQIPELSKYFRVVAVDLKGFGDSDKPVKTFRTIFLRKISCKPLPEESLERMKK
ncbi:epoxide hydrolase 4-like isoform X2 [Agrilus planipennis]|uniref:Epoxide hydrolase 4-like isoform X2 n=1 Tax=Agrilus planipennis TaxID=224129 RepID=A0A1W4XFE8_AGRPL|nr:epoxide hydrolase 4-like isoform X2 [Agrilus planipennis]